MSHEWMDDAACAQVDPELFFPDQANNGQAERARDVCAGCPVVADCLDFAIGRPDVMGIWGGSNLKQRQEIRASGAMTARVKRQAILAGLERRRHQKEAS